jgi:hypothetical protein
VLSSPGRAFTAVFPPSDLDSERLKDPYGRRSGYRNLHHPPDPYGRISSYHREDSQSTLTDAGGRQAASELGRMSSPTHESPSAPIGVGHMEHPAVGGGDGTVSRI